MKKNRSNLTEILIKKEYAEAMVNDFNHANLDLKNLNEADLKMAKLNIISIIGALDDLQKSINEELSKDTTEAKVKEILKGYTNSIEREYNENKTTQDTKEKGNTISTIKKSSCNIEMEVIEDKTEESNECTLEKINDRKDAKKDIEVDERIWKAIKIARKYNFGIPFIEDGVIVKSIRDGHLDNKQAILHIQNIYREALKTLNIDSEDVSDMIHVISLFDNENIKNKSNKDSNEENFLGEKITPEEYNEAKEILAEAIRERLIKKLISEVQNGKINLDVLPFEVHNNNETRKK